ncbi:MAG: SusC/RagA family TonB-linked outer membrane protein [Flavobacteriaceae bacterium]
MKISPKHYLNYSSRYLKSIVLLPVFLFISFLSHAQNLRITGTVTSDGAPLIGATIHVQGTLNGITTDFDGNYSINAKSSDILVYSYIGYKEQKVSVGTNLEINIELSEDAAKLDEVVVTALGITREKKALGYSVQELHGDDISKVKDGNFINNLQGKVAGAQIINSTGAVGGASTIFIRGTASLSGDNEPLFVVDGVPINNEVVQTSWVGFESPSNSNSDGFESGEVDYGNAASEINPNDVESVTILKGASAAALYGSRAANGVILITTKSGKGSKGLGIELNTSLTFQSPLRTPRFQTQYGAGLFNQYSYVDGEGGGVFDNAAVNFGPRLDGRLISQLDYPFPGRAIVKPWVSRLGSDPYRAFLETGITRTNNIAVTEGNEMGNLRLSYTNYDQKGMVPNTGLKRNTVSFAAKRTISDRVKASGAITYINTDSHNRPNLGSNNPYNPLVRLLTLGQNESLEEMKDYWVPFKEGIEEARPASGVNPYFLVNENTNAQKKDRIYGNININYKLASDLNLNLRSGVDFYNDRRLEKKAQTNFTFGSYRESRVFFTEFNSDFLLTYAPINEQSNFKYSINFGGTLMRQRQEQTRLFAPELEVPGVYNIGNTRGDARASQFIRLRGMNSLYGSGQFGYKNMLYLDVAVRNDWSSTLPKGNNSFLYPSLSFSGIITELFDERPSWLTFAKIRGSIAQVGKDAEPYQLENKLIYGDGFANAPIVSRSAIIANPNIKPEITTSYEVGADFRIFDSRFNIDMSYYSATSKNQSLEIGLPPESGYSRRTLNVGKLRNWGFEVVAGISAVRSKDFQWDIDLNFSRNRSEVIEFNDDLFDENFRFNVFERWLNFDHVKGQPLGNGYGDYLVYWDPATKQVGAQKDLGPNARLVHSNAGTPLESDDFGLLEGKTLIDNVYPDWIGGVRNTLRYKNISLGFLFDFRKGGIFYSRTHVLGNMRGALQESVEVLGNRDEFADADGFVVGNGVRLPDGVTWDTYTGDLVENDRKIPINRYYGPTDGYFGNDHGGSFDASFIKLREVNLTFFLPKSVTKLIGIQDGRFSIIGRNLLLWSKAPHVDPETSAYGGRAQGVEMITVPSARSIGVNLNLRL